MVIAINTTDFICPDNKDEFLKEFLLKSAAQFQEHTFIFISHQAEVDKGNVKNIAMKPLRSNSALAWLKYKLALKSVLKKNKADVFVTGYLLNIKIKQVLLLPSVNIISLPHFFSEKRSQFFGSHLKKYIVKADKIITSTENSKHYLQKHFNCDEDKIVELSLTEKNNLDKEQIKEKYTDGFEYFLFFAGGENVKSVIEYFKAFSFFKQRQKSSMKLILVADNNYLYNNLKKEMQLYKYRADVDLQVIDRNIFQLISGAYAVISTGIFSSFYNVIDEAQKNCVPLIAPKGENVSENSLEFETSASKEIADRMMLIFKDENLRRTIIDNYATSKVKNIAINEISFMDLLTEKQ